MYSSHGLFLCQSIVRSVLLNNSEFRFHLNSLILLGFLSDILWSSASISSAKMPWTTARYLSGFGSTYALSKGWYCAILKQCVLWMPLSGCILRLCRCSASLARHWPCRFFTAALLSLGLGHNGLNLCEELWDLCQRTLHQKAQNLPTHHQRNLRGSWVSWG